MHYRFITTAPASRWGSLQQTKGSRGERVAVTRGSSSCQSLSFAPRPKFLSAMVCLFFLGLATARAQESTSIAKQAQNPIANLISVPLENDFDPQTGYKREDSYVQEVKPVVPFRLSNDWNLITRTIIPIIQVPDLTPNVSGVSGLGDVELSLFLSPAKVGPVIWGVGPAISIPTATE